MKDKGCQLRPEEPLQLMPCEVQLQAEPAPYLQLAAWNVDALLCKVKLGSLFQRSLLDSCECGVGVC